MVADDGDEFRPNAFERRQGIEDLNGFPAV